jgi:hypothetical protein
VATDQSSPPVAAAAGPAAAAACLFLALAVFHTWPLASSPARLSLNHNADAQLNEWIVSWIAHTLPVHPTRVFDANIFAPERQTLTYSEPLIVPALLGAPIRWLGGSPVLTFNLLLIAGLTVSAGFVAWRWTGSAGAALLGGALAAFNVHLLTRLPHLQAAHAWGLPLSWYFADRIADRPTRRDAAGLALVLAATAATSLYWLVFAGAIVAVVLAGTLCALRVRAAAFIAGATAAGLLLASPVLLPYARFAASGASRPLEMVAQLSATPAGYLVSLSRMHAGWTTGFHTTDLDIFFPGFVALGLATIGILSTAFGRTPHRRRMLTIVAVAAVGVVCSFGPSTAVYRWLYAWVLPIRGLRAAARFGYLGLLAVAFAAAYGLARVERHRPAGARLLLGSAALLLVTAEVWQGPIMTMPFRGVPPIYSLLADQTGPVRLIEVPFYLPEEIFQNGEYVLNSTAHWRPLMNGYSGYTPMSYREKAETLWLFPAPFAMQTIQRAGATHVMVHLSRFGGEARDIERALDGRSDLKLMAGDRDGHRLYRVIRNEAMGH